ncbi:D-alanyl-D-alanine carboxypeptidase family protein [Pseudoclavibacter soli]|uniref:D-alanyl-D-alanine carboxypeptidase family protein n=1 Tax=Pseudoclavibacter soli TaxID=452623 RepID=UPI0003F693A2|nr:hypothetical protein [Pseudoclavibacter soli]
MTRRGARIVAGDPRLVERRGLALLIGVWMLTVFAALGAWGAWGPLPVQQVHIDTSSTVATVSSEATADAPAVQLAWPSTGSTAFTLRNDGAADASRQINVQQSNGDQSAQRIASITKVITVLRVLERYPLQGDEQGPEITLTEADEQLRAQYESEGGATQPVPVGQSLTEREIIELVLVPSSNNYATTLARWAFGDDATFLAESAAWLDANGLSGAVQVDPNGLGDGNVATPEQIVHLADLALDNEVVREVVSMTSATIEGVGTVESHNSLLGVDGVDGVKTGTLSGTANLAWSAHFEIDGTSFELIGATLGATEGHTVMQPEVGALIESIQRAITVQVFATAGQKVGTLSTDWSSESDLVAAGGVRALTWGAEPLTLEVQGAAVPAQAQAGTQAGTLVLKRGDQTLQQTALLLASAIPDPGFSWRMSHLGELVEPTLAAVTGSTRQAA